MTSMFRNGLARLLGSVMVAAVLLTPVPAFAYVPETSKSVSTGTEYTNSVLVGTDSDISFHVECGLPQDADDLTSCRYAISDELPTWAEVDEGSVGVFLVTPGGTAYDLTEAFEVFVSNTTLRAQCDALREELPAALIDGSRVVMEYSARVGELNEVPTDSTFGAHLTMTPENGTAKTEASADAVVDLVVVCLDVHVKDSLGNALKGEKVTLSSVDGDFVVTTDDKGTARFVGIGNGPYDVEQNGVRLDATIALSLSDGSLDFAAVGEDLTDPYVEDGGRVCGVSLAMPTSATKNSVSSASKQATMTAVGACMVCCGLLSALSGILAVRRRPKG